MSVSTAPARAGASFTRIISSAVVAFLVLVGVVAIAAPAQAATPVAYGDTYGSPIDTPINVPAPGVMSNDVAAAGYEVMVVATSVGIGNTLQVSPSGSLTFTTRPGFAGESSFDYCLASGGTCVSNTVTAYLYVGQPYLYSQAYQALEGQTLNVPASEGLLVDAGNIDDETLLVRQSLGGTATVEPDGSFSFAPNAGFTGRAYFDYCLADDGLCISAGAQASIAVYPALSNQSFSVAADSSHSGTLYPAPSGGISYVGLVTSQPANGELDTTNSGAFTYTPDSGYSGPDSFSYCLSIDGAGCISGTSPVTASVTVTPNEISTTTTLSGTTSLRFGQSLTLSAAVSPIPGGGTVAFSEDGAVCADQPVSSGAATCTIAQPTVGSHSYLAQFSGSWLYLPSSDSLEVTVNKAQSTLAYTGPAAVTVGEPFELAVLLTSPTLDLSGENVSLSFDGQNCSGAVDDEGSFSCTVTPSSAGPVELTLTYDGSATVEAATETGDIQVSQQASTTTLDVDDDTPVWGETVTFTATVSVIATGTVTFTTDEGALPGCESVNLTGGVVANCVAAFDVGEHEVTATYSGNETFDESSDTIAIEALRRSTTLEYTGPQSGTVGEPLAVNALLTSDADPLEGIEISFTLAGSSAADCTALTGDDGRATCELTVPSAGAVSVEISHEGTDYYLPNSITEQLQVGAAATTTTLTGTEEIVIGGMASLTATVSPTDGAGTVTFTAGADAIEGCEEITLADVEGAWTAECTTATLPVGENEIVATYSGTSNYLTSSDTATVEVLRAPATLTYTGDVTGVVGEPLIVSADFDAAFGGLAPTLEGFEVTFTFDGETCTGTTDFPGSAECTFTPTAAQTSPVSVTFAGSTDITPAQTSEPVTIAAAPTTTEVTGPDAGEFTEPLTFTAQVAPTVGAGTVTFTAGEDVIEGCEEIALADVEGTWTAECSTAALPVGESTVTASYTGTADYEPSEGSTQVTVAPAPTALALVAPETVTVGEHVTLTGTLINAVDGSVLAGASLTFIWSGEECLATTDADGVATCAFDAVTVAQSGDVQVAYAGTDDYESSSASAGVEVLPAATATTLTASPAGAFPAPVTLSATVSPTDGSGTVTFTAGGEPIAECAEVALTETDEGWTATCEVTPLTAGEQEYGAEFSGTDDYLPSSAATTANVDKTATTLTALGPDEATEGEPVTVSVLLAAPAVEGAPAGDRARFAVPTEIIGGGDAADVDLSGQEIAFTLGDQTCTGVTDADGRAECEITPGTAGEQTLMASFAGSADLTAAQAEVTITVEAAPVDAPPALPDTGADLATMVAVLAALLLGGLCVRRARRQHS
ncbi:Ig-like domain repeat protein [Ruania alkalisoli]|uniref:Ig-like domain repeat protein n=1 Tax=Ruania alkalisoli TaxID=2779775 RepID=A0A7M1ST15_9MICO|nr:Ig-like domain repeat protein [Ruania alkalisoli]QOR70706.1 Ig-like domain repeat protein [Ruania alkalisoli]